MVEQNVTTSDLSDLEAEFAKHLVLVRENAGVSELPQEEVIQEETKKRGLLKKLSKMKKNFMDKIVMHKAFVENLMPEELDQVKKFMDRVILEKNRQPPPPLKRPEGLQLNLIGIALFSGNESVSKAIRYITKSNFSHVALLLHDATTPADDMDGWYVYSANGSASQIMVDRRMPQVQLEKWKETVEAYDGAVVSRLILFSSSIPPTSVITELVDKFIGMPYEKQLLIMFKAINRSNVEQDGSEKSAFCSEICYRFLAAANVIEDTEVPENVWPKHFSSETSNLKLVGATWDQEVKHKDMPPQKSKSTKF